VDTASAGANGKLAGGGPVGRQHHRRPHRKTAVLVAVLFLTSTAAFAIGSSLLASHFSGDSPGTSTLLAGVLLIYSFTAVGGIIFSYLLYASGLVPRLLSMLGMLGYVALLVGIPTALVGFADLDTGWGVIFLVPGGLFELILPVLLLVKGFSVATAADPATDGPAVNPTRSIKT
jgi:hypothetical protein